MLTISTFGTSLTAGGGWQAPLAQKIETKGVETTILNRGKSGASSAWGITRAAAIAAETPDIVLVEFAVNDAAFKRGLPLAPSLDNMARIFGELRVGAPNRLIILQRMNPVRGYRRWLRPFLDHYTRAHIALAGSLGLPVIDHTPLWSQFDSQGLRRAIPDGLHPDANLTAEVIATSIYGQLVKMPEFSRLVEMP